MAFSPWQHFVTDATGAIDPTAVVVVRLESNGAVANIKSDAAGSVKANPFTVAIDGLARFYAAGGDYKVVVNEGQPTEVSFRHVKIGEAAGFDVGADGASKLLTRDQLDARYSAQVQNNLTAIVDPAVTDDSGSGYAENSTWFNTSTEEVWRCLSAAVGAAVWVKTTLTLDELGSAATLDAGVANGVGTLDAGTLQPTAEMNASAVRYAGGYDVAGGTPSAGTKKDVYLLTGVGSLALTNGSASAGQYIIYDGTEWLILSSPAGGISWGAFNNGSAPSVAPSATGLAALAIGDTTIASANYSIAFGFDTEASVSRASAFGYQSIASSTDALAWGYQSVSSGSAAIAIGYNNDATGAASVAISSNAFASGGSAIAIGSGSDATGNQSAALGNTAQALNTQATAIGYAARADGTFSVALGSSADSGGSHSVTVGYQANASSSSAISIGRASDATGPSSLALGHGSQALHDTSAAFGASTETWGSNQVRLGARASVLGKDGVAVMYSSPAAQGVSVVDYVALDKSDSFWWVRATSCVKNETTGEVQIKEFKALVETTATTITLHGTVEEISRETASLGLSTFAFDVIYESTICKARVSATHSTDTLDIQTTYTLDKFSH